MCIGKKKHFCLCIVDVFLLFASPPSIPPCTQAPLQVAFKPHMNDKKSAGQVKDISSKNRQHNERARKKDLNIIFLLPQPGRTLGGNRSFFFLHQHHCCMQQPQEGSVKFGFGLLASFLHHIKLSNYFLSLLLLLFLSSTTTTRSEFVRPTAEICAACLTCPEEVIQVRSSTRIRES